MKLATNKTGMRLASGVLALLLVAVVAIPSSWNSCFTSLITGVCVCCPKEAPTDRVKQDTPRSCCADQADAAETVIKSQQQTCGCKLSSPTEQEIILAEAHHDADLKIILPIADCPEDWLHALVLPADADCTWPPAHAPPKVASSLYRLVCNIRC